MKLSHLLTLATAALLANVASAQSGLASIPFSGPGQDQSWPVHSDWNRFEHGRSFAGSQGAPSWPGSYSPMFQADDSPAHRKFGREDESENASARMGHGEGVYHFAQWGDFDSGCWDGHGHSSGGTVETGEATGSPIPEPSTYAAMLGLTALGLAVSRRKVARAARDLRG